MALAKIDGFNFSFFFLFFLWGYDGMREKVVMEWYPFHFSFSL